MIVTDVIFPWWFLQTHNRYLIGFNHSSHFPASYVGNMKTGESAGHSSCSGGERRRETVTGNGQEEVQKGCGRKWWLVEQADPRCMTRGAHPSAKVLDFPRLCEHEGKSRDVVAMMLWCVICDIIKPHWADTLDLKHSSSVCRHFSAPS